MNKEEFEEKARKILHRLPEKQKEKFFRNFDYDEVSLLEYASGPVEQLTDEYLYDHAKGALEHLKPIYNGRFLILRDVQDDLENVIWYLDNICAFNKQPKRAGPRSSISGVEFTKLLKLKEAFLESITARTASYNKDTVLYKLGELLIGRPPPSSVDESIDLLLTNKYSNFPRN